MNCQSVYGNTCLFRSLVLEKLKRLKKDRKDIDDDEPRRNFHEIFGETDELRKIY